MKSTTSILGGIGIAALALGCGRGEPDATPLTREEVETKTPNVLLVVTDDMGYSDYSPFGGEIRTPNIQGLADRGVALTDFYAAPTCSPSRSQLLTGVENHTAGIGTMEEWLAVNQAGEWGYEGHIADRVATMAETLGEAGYHTALSGKWHLGSDIAHDPSKRGFDRSFTLIEGVAPHFAADYPVFPGATYTYRMDGASYELPEDFYSSRFYTDTLIEFLEDRDEDQPFFGYLAFTAPHDPLQVPDDWLDRYEGAYNDGYGALRERRLERLQELGIVVPEVGVPPRIPWVPAWEDLPPEAQAAQSRHMEIYAAMIEYVDAEIGRLLAWLEAEGELDNTIIVFFSDNGANGSPMSTYPGSSPEWTAANFDNSLGNIGRIGSGVDQGPGWAQASMTPFLYYKGFMSEGGVRSPAILAGYGIERVGEMSDTVASVQDVYPTVLELAGVDHPTRLGDREIVPPQGVSMAPFLAGDSDIIRSEETPVMQELFGGRMIRSGKWKALRMDPPFGTGDWQLFDMTRDVTELVDLGPDNPEVLAGLVARYEVFTEDVRIIDPPFTVADIVAGTVDPAHLAHHGE